VWVLRRLIEAAAKMRPSIKKYMNRYWFSPGLFLLLSGCSAINQTFGISPTDLSWIKLGMEKTQIENRLGQGQTRDVQDNSKTRIIYTFDRGYHPPSQSPALWKPIEAVGWEAMNLGSLGARSYWERECQRSILELHYDKNSRLIYASEGLIDLGNIGTSGTRQICNRVRFNLAPSTLDVDASSNLGK